MIALEYDYMEENMLDTKINKNVFYYIDRSLFCPHIRTYLKDNSNIVKTAADHNMSIQIYTGSRGHIQ